MSLTGLQIFKYLPGGKKEKEANCKNCGFPTCMAYAMKLAKKETTSDKCEYISSELKELLEEASQPQQQEISFGPTNNPVITGNETVMFRHDKKFVNQSCIAIRLKSSQPDFETVLEKIKLYSLERVGEMLTVTAIALEDNDSSFVEKAGLIVKKDIPLILISSDAEKIKQALSETASYNPLVYLRTSNTGIIADISNEFNCPVVISGTDITSLSDNVENIAAKGAQKILLKPDYLSVENLTENLTFIRRAAIEDKYRHFGFPVITFIDEINDIGDDVIEKTMWASVLVCKYSNIIVLDYFDEAMIYALLALRQNIFTDPQKPLQIEAKIYPVGDVTQDSPVFVTTNFALTYFTVVSEIEATGIPAYLLVTPSDGMSVLTAWAASKFTGEIIAKAVKDFGLESMVKHRNLIIPGYVSSLKEEIKEELPAWTTLTGPNEAVDIPDYLKSIQSKK